RPRIDVLMCNPLELAYPTTYSHRESVDPDLNCNAACLSQTLVAAAAAVHCHWRKYLMSSIVFASKSWVQMIPKAQNELLSEKECNSAASPSKQLTRGA
ncbi:unnamed protein product, partial [Ceratitis capitata]